MGVQQRNKQSVVRIYKEYTKFRIVEKMEDIEKLGKSYRKVLTMLRELEKKISDQEDALEIAETIIKRNHTALLSITKLLNRANTHREAQREIELEIMFQEEIQRRIREEGMTTAARGGWGIVGVNHDEKAEQELENALNEIVRLENTIMLMCGIDPRKSKMRRFGY